MAETGNMIKKLSALQNLGQLDIAKKDILAYLKAEAPNLPGDFVRELKDAAIGIATLAGHYAAEGGLPYEVMRSWRDAAVFCIEKAGTTETLVDNVYRQLMLLSMQVQQSVGLAHYSETVGSALKYIIHHVDDELTLGTVAAAVSISPDYLSNLVKQETGFSVPQLIRRSKIVVAKRLLLSKTDSILDVAYHLSFSSQSQFSIVFKKETGMTPTEYRKYCLEK